MASLLNYRLKESFVKDESVRRNYHEISPKCRKSVLHLKLKLAILLLI